jgi:DNA-binding PadR family transcriptional regulator
MPKSKCDVPQGTLDLMILKTLNQGTIYPALLRLEQRKWIRSDWGASDTGRRESSIAHTYRAEADRRGRRKLVAHSCPP